MHALRSNSFPGGDMASNPKRPRSESSDRWVVASRLQPQGDERVRWIQLTIAREVCPEVLDPAPPPASDPG